MTPARNRSTHLLLLGPADLHPRPPGRDVLARPVGHLPDRRRRSCRPRTAISSYGTSKTSRSTNTARSVGVSVSSTVSSAYDTLSASSTSSATS